MKDSYFDIINKKNPSNSNSKSNIKTLYQNLYQTYLSLSYGYYTETFIKKITQKSQNQHEKLLKFELRKLLRESIKKYLMTDLEIIYLAYFANLHEWHFNHPVILESLNGTESDPEIHQVNKIKLFLNLISFFIKSYVGSKEQLSIMIDFHRENMPLFLTIYKLWMEQNNKKLFIISPRQLNSIYTEYSRYCGQKVIRKDYNEMVDKILDLSTTYTIISTKQRKINQTIPIISEEKVHQEQNVSNPLKRVTRNSSLSDLDKSYKIEFSDLRSQKKQSIILAGLSNLFTSNIDQQKVQPQSIEKPSQPKKLISLNKKKKFNRDEPNNVAKNFFCNKQMSYSLEDQKKSDIYLKDSLNFLDMDSRIENLPFSYRNSSNIFGPSNFF